MATTMDSVDRIFPSFQKVIMGSAVLKTILWGSNYVTNEEIKHTEK